jgi:hypothetical protein
VSVTLTVLAPANGFVDDDEQPLAIKPTATTAPPSASSENRRMFGVLLKLI